MAEMKAGEEIDYDSACIVEGEKLQGYIFAQLDQYRNDNPTMVATKKMN